jgi:hypothetical protein
MPGPKTFTELTVDSGSTSIIGKQLANNKIFFLMSVTIDEVVYEGLWSIATPEEGSGLSLSLEYMLTNATATSVTAATLRGFFVYANHAFLSFQNSSGTYILNRTARTFAYAATSKYTTGVNPGMDPMDKSKEKQLTAVSVSYEALPTDASMTLEYRVDGGSWTTIFTETTNSAVNTERIMDASGAEFTKGRDYEFRLGSTGGGEIVELAYAYESLSSLMHP